METVSEEPQIDGKTSSFVKFLYSAFEKAENAIKALQNGDTENAQNYAKGSREWMSFALRDEYSNIANGSGTELMDQVKALYQILGRLTKNPINEITQELSSYLDTSKVYLTNFDKFFNQK